MGLDQYIADDRTAAALAGMDSSRWPVMRMIDGNPN